MSKKNKKKFILFAVLLAIIAGCFLFYEKKHQQKSSIQNQTIAKTLSQNDNVQSFENVLIQTDNKTQLINIFDGKKSEANFIEQGDFSEFSGFPQLNKDQIATNSPILISKNNKKVILSHTVGGQEGVDSESLQTSENSEQYLCDIEQKYCQKSDLLTKSYQGINYPNDGSSIWWFGWDSERNLIYGHLSGGDFGDVSPVYVCDTNTYTCKKTQGFDSQTQGEVRANVPEGAFSPSLGKFVMVNQNDVPDQQTGNKWDLLLYDSNDLSKPTHVFDISAAINQDESVSYDSVFAVSWRSDEKKLAFATANRIYLLDLESGSLELLYMSSTDEDDQTYLDSSLITFSSDDKFLVFVEDMNNDSDENTSTNANNENTDQGNNMIGILKKIDLQKNNQVSEIYQEENLSLKK